MRAWTVLLLSLAAVALLAACGEREKGAPAGERNGETPTVRPSPTRGAVGNIGDLQLRLGLDKTAYRQGEAVRISLTVTNGGEQPLTLFFTDSQRYDFTVMCGPTEQCPEPTWQWSHTKVFAQVLGQEVLAPGQSVTFSETWDQRDNDGQPVAPDTYEAYASLVGCPDEAGKRCDPLESDIIAFQVVP